MREVTPWSPWGLCIVSLQALLLSLMCTPFLYWFLLSPVSSLQHPFTYFFLHYFVTMTTLSLPLSKPVMAGLVSWGSQILWEAVFSRSFYPFLFGVTATHNWASEAPASHRFKWFSLLVNNINRSSSDPQALGTTASVVQKDIIQSWQFSPWQSRPVLLECLATEEDTQQSPGPYTPRTTPK